MWDFGFVSLQSNQSFRSKESLNIGFFCFKEPLHEVLVTDPQLVISVHGWLSNLPRATAKRSGRACFTVEVSLNSLTDGDAVWLGSIVPRFCLIFSFALQPNDREPCR